ncbi:MAG: two-component regulator propeller domain-containing protein [Cytophagales bacterium]|nr:two-component regulator propeller domain-containing protein [Cytophagales bacterium]
MRLLLTCVIFFSVLYIIKCQNAYHFFEHYNIDDGLPQNQVNHIFRDSKGYLWVACNKSLAKYDGYTFQSFSSPDYDSSILYKSAPTQIIEDDEGNIWLTHNNGIIKYNYDADRFINMHLGDTLLSKGSDWIAKGADGSLWISVKDESLINYDIKTNKYKRYKYDVNNPDGMLKGGINSLHVDDDGVVWFTSWSNGISRYNATTDDFTHYLHDPADTNSIIDKPIFGMASDLEGGLWVGAHDYSGSGYYLARLDKKTGKFIRYKSDKILHRGGYYRMARDKFGNMWFASLLSGVTTYDMANKKFSNYQYDARSKESITENVISSIHIDYDNKMWLGTVNRGLNKTDLNLKDIYVNNVLTQFNENDLHIHRLEEDMNHNIWISGTQGLYIYDIKNNKLKKMQLPDNVRVVYDVIYALDKMIYYANTGVAYMIDPNTFKITKPHFKYYGGQPVLRYVKNKKGQVFAMVFDGVYLHRDGNIFGKPELLYINPKANNGHERLCHYEYGDDIFLGSSDYFIRYNSKTDETESLSPPVKGMGFICSMYNMNDTLWVAFTQKLYKYSLKQHKVISIEKYQYFNNEEEVMPSVYLYSDSNMCISTHFGVFSYNIYSKKHTKLNFYDNDRINPDLLLQTSKGKYYLSTNIGFIEFAPAKLKSYINFKPKVQLTGLYLFNENVVANDKHKSITQNIINASDITFTHEQSVFALEMTMLNMINSQNNQYKYILKGFDKKWNFIGSRKVASFTNLPPGDYQFIYAAANENELWSDEKYINIHILPPFWETWWFRIAGLISLGGGIYAFIFFRTYNIKKQKEYLEKQVILRTAEIVSQKEEIWAQKEEIEAQQHKIAELYKDVTDSIHTAQAIQQSILPTAEMIDAIFNENFILYLPKDIVSGDYYWYHADDDYAYIGAIDCTGHGVAGAFMTLIAHSLINRIIIENDHIMPHELLDKLSNYLIKALHQESEKPISKDGMDVALCRYDRNNNKLHFAGANNPLYYIKNNTLEIQKGDNNSVGLQILGKKSKFTCHTFEIEAGDIFYLFSDGYASQFGGEMGDEKMKYHRFREVLQQNYMLPLDVQKYKLSQFLASWQISSAQTDDILVIGFKIP